MVLHNNRLLGPLYNKRGLQDSLWRTSSNVKSASVFNATTFGIKRSTEKASGKRSGRKGFRSKLSRLLQPPFSSSKEGRLLETSYRPVSTKQVYYTRTFPNGKHHVNPQISKTAGLGGLLRPGRHLLSHIDSPSVTKVSSFHCRKSSISVPCSPIRTFNSSSGVHIILLMSVVSSHLRTLGVPILQYLDD